MADDQTGDGLLPKETPSQSGYEPEDWFWETRKKGPSPIGTVVYSTLRALDVPFQYWLLRSGAAVNLLQAIGARAVTPPLTLGTGTLLGLSPYHSLIVGLAAGSSIKHIYWKLAIGQEIMRPSFAITIGTLNTFYNSLNTIVAVWSMTSQQPRDQTSFRSFLATARPSVYIGVIYYVLGLSIEWYSEVQRKKFKDDPNNEGLPYSDGLFGLSRHINYGGYALWRSAYNLVCGGWLYGGTMFLSLASHFIDTAIPRLEAYCEKKVSVQFGKRVPRCCDAHIPIQYGGHWEEVKNRNPFRFLPWIY